MEFRFLFSMIIVTFYSPYIVGDIHHVDAGHTSHVMRHTSVHWDEYFAPLRVRNAVVNEVIRHLLRLLFTLLISP